MTTQTSGSETSIKVVMFNGEKWEWTTWIEKFLARGMAKGYYEVVAGEVTIPTASEDPTKLTSEQKKILKKNIEAYGDLVLSMNTSTAGGRVAFNIIKSSKTDEYPKGNAAVAMAHLKRKYEPTTAPAMLKMSQTYQNATLKKGKDPDNFITYMEDLRTRLEPMGWKVDDTQFLVKILNSLPDDYEYQMNDMEKRIGNGLTIEDVREELNLRFERLCDKEKKSKKHGNGNGGETALFAGGFKGRCHNCGKYGHKASDCKDKSSSGDEGNSNGNNTHGSGFTGRCYKCKEKGHKASECPKKKNNEEMAEVALMAVDFGDDDLTDLVAENETVAVLAVILAKLRFRMISLIIGTTSGRRTMITRMKRLHSWRSMSRWDLFLRRRYRSWKGRVAM